jgi:hypothetical protein
MDRLYRWRVYPLIFLLAASACAAFTTIVFFRDPGVDFHRATVPTMVDGTAWRPFVYRTLLPTVVRGLSAAVPAPLDRAIESAAAENRLVSGVFNGLQWDPAHGTVYLLAGALSFALFFAFAYAFRFFYRGLYDEPPWLGDIAGLVILLALPIGFTYGSKIYDPATLFLTTFALGLMARRRFGMYLAVFVLCCLNKETAIVLPFVFALYFFFADKRMPIPALAGWLALQAVLFVAIKGAVNFVFRDNPGVPFEHHLGRNLDWLFQPYSVETLVAWAVLYLLIADRWFDKPPFARWALAMALPLMGLGFIMGYFDEIRGYYEMFPVLAILMAHSVARHMGYGLVQRRTDVAQPVLESGSSS